MLCVVKDENSVDNRTLSISYADCCRVILSELHLTRSCRTEPVAPALPYADLVGVA
jgi:hypothetical protein